MGKKDQSQQTRDALLNAAVLLFGKGGYEATSVSSICSQAGVSKGAFYHHFNSKHNLFFELMQRWLDDLEARLELLEADQEQVSQKLLAMAGVVGEVLDVGGPQLSIYLEFWNQALRDQEVHGALKRQFDDFLGFFAGLLQSGMEQGSIMQSNAVLTARVITALGIGLLFQGLLDPEAAEWNQVTAFGLTLLFEGLNNEGEQ